LNSREFLRSLGFRVLGFRVDNVDDVDDVGYVDDVVDDDAVVVVVVDDDDDVTFNAQVAKLCVAR